MATCAYCNTEETELYERGLPIAFDVQMPKRR